MPVHSRSRAAARGLLSLALLSGIGLERVSRAAEPSDRRAQPAATKPAPTTGTEAEGIVHIWRSPEPEGFVSLRHMPHVGRWIAWLMPGGFAIAAAPAAPAPTNKESRSPEELRQELLKLSGRRTLPVMVAPLDSCTPVDVGRIEDLIFPDPATADRIIRAAGQGFRVVVMTPIADPNPSPHSHDCPRPLQATPAQPAGEAHPQPTLVRQEIEGRVLLSGPRATGSVDPSDNKEGIARTSGQPAAVSAGPAAPKQAPLRLPFGSVDPPNGGFFLVPHPAPAAAAASPFHIALGAEPKRIPSTTSPSEHLRLAAGQLAEQGLHAEADRLRDEAKRLDQKISDRLMAIHRQQEELKAEFDRLIAIHDETPQVEVKAEIVEIDRVRMATPPGVALVRKHLKDRFEETSPLWPQVTAAALSAEFRREAAEQKFLTTYSRPRVLSVVGQKAEIQVGPQVTSQIEGLSLPSELGISLSLIPERLEGHRLRLSVRPAVKQFAPVKPKVTTPTGTEIPGLITRMMTTELSLSLGQTAVIGGFVSPRSHRDAGTVQLTAGEMEDAQAQTYEILFILTPTESSTP